MSGLKAGARPLEVCQNLCLSANPAEVISDVILHGDTAFFLVFANAQIAEATIQHFAGKPVFDGYRRVDGLNSKSHQILMQLKPKIFGAVGKTTASTGSEVPTSDIKSSAKLSDMLEAIAGWSLEQKQQLGAALGFSTSGAVAKPTSFGQGPQVPAGPGATKMGVPYIRSDVQPTQDGLFLSASCATSTCVFNTSSRTVIPVWIIQHCEQHSCEHLFRIFKGLLL